jgi:hypothetical protein
VREFLIENWGNLASVAGLLVSLGALFFARSAAETAKLVRQEMQRYNLYDYLAVLVAQFREFLLLTRLAKWEIVRLRADDLSASLSLAIAKWDNVFDIESKNRLDSARNLLRQIIMKLNESEPRGPSEEIKKDLLTSADLALEQIISTQGQLSRDIETSGADYARQS